MTDTTLGAEGPMTQTQDPFVLRAHHAQQIFRMLAIGQELGSIVEDSERFARQYLPRAYFRDTFGDSSDQAEAFNTNALNFYQQFLDLPSEANIKIVTNQKDPICNGCAIGKHCDKWTNYDVSWLKAVKTTAGILMLGHTVEEGQDVVLRSDGSSKTAPTLTLPAYTVRAVCADINLRSRTYPRLVQFLIRGVDRRALERRFD